MAVRSRQNKSADQKWSAFVLFEKKRLEKQSEHKIPGCFSNQCFYTVYIIILIN
nr:MAG TPA: hypothetical protein [Caudoviricetes sp.]